MVETDIGKRWEEGIEHHPESEELYSEIAHLDFEYGDDRFCFKSGGDGDNGEHLMYLLDIYFERKYEEDNIDIFGHVIGSSIVVGIIILLIILCFKTVKWG